MTQTAKVSQRRPSHEWRLAPCGSADTRCANLRAIFDSVVLALSTNFMVQIDLVWAQLSPALRFASILKVFANSVVRRKAVWRRARHFLIRKGCRHPKFFSSCAPNHGAWMAGTSQKHSCGCALFVFFPSLYEPASENFSPENSCIVHRRSHIIEITREITLETREITQR